MAADKAMDTGADIAQHKVEQPETKGPQLDEFALGMMKKPLYAIHPRRSNRSVTMWKGAVTLRLDDTFPAAFKTLHEENILGAPVVTSNGRFYGFVDMFDFLMFITRLFPADQDVNTETLTQFFQKEEKATKTTVRELLDILHPDRNWKDYKLRATVPKDMSLFYAWESMIRTGRKRMAVIDETQQVCSLINQSMCIGWAYNNLEDTLKAVRDMRIDKVQFEKKVVTVQEGEPTMKAFRLMAEHRVHGIAVVDSKGQMQDVISIRDLRGINPTADEFLRLWRPVSAFKKEVREKYPGKTPVYPDLYILPSDSLRTAIVMMDEDRVHRLFVVASAMDKTPIGVITQTDVLRYLMDAVTGPLFKDDEEQTGPTSVPIAAAKPLTSSASAKDSKDQAATAPVPVGGSSDSKKEATATMAD